MNNELEITTLDGKYTIILDKDGHLYAYRYGNEWRDCIGDNLILSLAQDIQSLREEINRLKDGNFTEDEFQNLCHKFQDADRQRFCDGCENYQIKLFGNSPISELKNAIKNLIETMEMQEKREKGEFHINQPTAWAIWNEAKETAKNLIK